jgi:hypothetical protein
MKRVVEVYKFPRMAVVELEAKGRHIHRQMEEHVGVFPSPVPTMPELKDALDEFHKYIEAAKNSDRVALAFCRDNKQKVAAMLQRLGAYVNFIASDGNRVVGALSGFDLIAERGSAPKIAVVRAPTLSGNIMGQITSTISSVTGATMYKHCITADASMPVDTWPSCTSGRVQHVFKNLISGQRYTICTAGSNGDGNWVYSQPVSRIAL